MMLDTQIKLDRKKVWETSLRLGFPCAFWRYPDKTDKHFLVNFLEKPLQTKIDFEELGSGFVFAPYDNPDGCQSYFLAADLVVNFDENEEIREIVSPVDTHELYQNFISELRYTSSEKNTKTNSSESVSGQFSKERFIDLVNRGIVEIKAGKFQKVVPSRTKEIELAPNFDLIETFDKVCELYPTAFVSLVSLPHLGVVWMCASPEILVSQNQTGIFRTMALAGTQSAYDANGVAIQTSEAMWRQKEIEEQALVSRYIINCFKRIRVREFEEIGPKTVVAGNLMHLRTEFLVDTQEVNFPQLATVMLDLLHPTSAVCGMPKIPANEFLLANEGYNREFYSGYLGAVNIEGESHLFVNLRTMKITGNKAILYAGCGITEDSDPEKEWYETEMKCETLGRVLK